MILLDGFGLSKCVSSLSNVMRALLLILGLTPFPNGALQWEVQNILNCEKDKERKYILLEDPRYYTSYEYSFVCQSYLK